MGGGNLSSKVHPLTKYIQQHFGMQYTQDESYYVLDPSPGQSFISASRTAWNVRSWPEIWRTPKLAANHFPQKNTLNQFPAKKHEHFMIPAGTVHCSGAESMVLEISATP